MELLLGALEEKKGAFVRHLLALSFPIMLQNLLISSVSFIDTLMISLIGEQELAAVGLANQVFFLISLFFFGVSSGAAIFFAQYWGAGDQLNMHRILGIALLFSLFGACICSFFSMAFPQTILRIFTDDAAVLTEGATYLTIVGISYPFTAVVIIYSAALRSSGDAKTPLYTSAFSMGLNILLNYLLIFGKWGFPRMEVAGAAWASLISRTCEMVCLLSIIYGKKLAPAAKVRSMFSFSRSLAGRYFVTCMPVILNETFWSLGMTTYKVAFARLGVDVIASVNVSEAIQGLFFVVLMGISNASAIMIGNRIGENRLETARLYASKLLKTAVAAGILLGGLLVILSPWLPLPFHLSAPIHRMTSRSLRSLGLLVPIKAFNMVLIVGVLRSGGDTRFSMITELAGVWCIGVPCAFIGALVLDMPIYYLYLFIGLEELFKCIIGAKRVHTGKWVNRLTTDTRVST